MKLNRREFVYSLSALAVAPPGNLIVRSQTVDSAKSLTETELKLLDQFCEHIIPKDEHPGAHELGVVNFINRMLNEAHPDWVVVYRSGLSSLDLSSRDLYGKAFIDLDSVAQITLMKKMETGDLPRKHWFGIEFGEIFAMIRSHAMQGYYSHPKWGGNRNKLAWEMIGYDDWWV